MKISIQTAREREREREIIPFATYEITRVKPDQASTTQVGQMASTANSQHL